MARPLVELLGRYSRFPDPWQKLAALHKRLTEPPAEPTPTVGVPASTPRWRLDHRLTDETITQLIADYQAGVSSYVLAERYKISKWAVLHLLHEASVPLRRQGLSPDEIRHATLLYESGHSLTQVAAALTVSKTTLANTLRRAGVRLRPGRRDAFQPPDA